MQYLDSFLTGTINRKYIKPLQMFNEIKITLSSLSEQKKRIENYHESIKQAQSLKTQAKQKLKENVFG